MTSKDDDKTEEFPSLEMVVPQKPNNHCQQCAGNGVIATDSDVVTCPRCHGTKVEPNDS